MEYLQRLSVLQTLYTEISLQLTNATAEPANQEKINEYHQILKQIEAEIDRIEKMRSYKPNLSR